MCYVVPSISAPKSDSGSRKDEFEAYYTAEPADQPTKPAPELTALDLMYAYYDAA